MWSINCSRASVTAHKGSRSPPTRRSSAAVGEASVRCLVRPSNARRVQRPAGPVVPGPTAGSTVSSTRAVAAGPRRRGRSRGPRRPRRGGPRRHRPAPRARLGPGLVALVRRRLGAAARWSSGRCGPGEPFEWAMSPALFFFPELPVYLLCSLVTATPQQALALNGVLVLLGVYALRAGGRERADALRASVRRGSPCRRAGRAVPHAAGADGVLGLGDVARAHVAAPDHDVLLRRRAGAARHGGARAPCGPGRAGVRGGPRHARPRRRVHDGVEPAVRAVVRRAGRRHAGPGGAAAPGAVAARRCGCPASSWPARSSGPWCGSRSGRSCRSTPRRTCTRRARRRPSGSSRR